MMLTTSFDYNCKSIIDDAADFFLWPVRYAFHGRDVNVALSRQAGDGTKFQHEFIDRSAPERDWTSTMVTIATFAPGLVVGTAAKAIAFVSSSGLRECYGRYRDEPPLIDVDTEEVYLVQAEPYESWSPGMTRWLGERFSPRTPIQIIIDNGRSEEGPKISVEDDGKNKIFVLVPCYGGGCRVFAPEGPYAQAHLKPYFGNVDITVLYCALSESELPWSKVGVINTSQTLYAESMNFEVWVGSSQRCSPKRGSGVRFRSLMVALGVAVQAVALCTIYQRYLR